MASKRQVKNSQPIPEQRRERLQQLLDRYRTDALARRDAKAWERYYGVYEAAMCMGYTITVHSDRTHVLTWEG